MEQQYRDAWDVVVTMLNVERQIRKNESAARAGHLTFDIFEAATNARRIAKAYHKLCERACDDEAFCNLPEADQESAFEKLEHALALAFAAIPGIVIDTQRDPRGWEIKIHYGEVDISQLLYAAKL